MVFGDFLPYSEWVTAMSWNELKGEQGYECTRQTYL